MQVGKRLSTQWTGNWVIPSTGLDSVEKRTCLAPAGIEPQFLEHPTSRALKLIK
jgi:hypothetical protein